MDNEAVQRLEKLQADRPELWGFEKHQPITPRTLEALNEENPDLRFTLFFPERLFAGSSTNGIHLDAVSLGSMDEYLEEDEGSRASIGDIELIRKFLGVYISIGKT